MLALIPARAGSVGVPAKALRTVAGVPMILRTLRTVEASGVATRILVSTDCPNIASFCELRGFEVLHRPPMLATDDVPLIDVARHAAKETGWSGTLGIFQPTCPLLTAQTIREVVAEYRDRGLEWAITATRAPHIYWHDGVPVTERRQRQDLHIMRESGAVQLMERVDPIDGRMSPIGTIEIHPHEAVDVDTYDDLRLAEELCSRRRIHFVVLMGDRVGTGHYHRSRTLAESLAHHAVSWEWREGAPDWARAQIPYPETPDGRPDLVIFDCLDPGAHNVAAHHAAGSTVVALETEGADLPGCLAIDDMGRVEDMRYAILRPEFLCLPERDHREGASRVLLTFGGTDPAKLRERCARVLFGVPDVRQVVPGGHVQMAAELRWADVVVTSQGRTVYEAAACGTPCIAIAANDREARHMRIPGVTYLGLHATVTDDQIRQTVRATLGDVNLRAENARMAAAMIDGRGLDRMVRRIEGMLA